MIVYRDQKRATSVSESLAEIAALLRRMAVGPTFGHDEAVELVINIGEIESAVIESICPFDDHRDPAIAAYRRAGVAAGHIFRTTWEQKIPDARFRIEGLRRHINELASLPVPENIQVSVPEGYAFYGLFPEMYYEAARRYCNDCKHTGVFCIGIRSIGTSLSAIVAAVLEDRGHAVETVTLRPRGHAFNRSVKVSGELEEHLRSRNSSDFLIIDEGPGLSGSSFCCIAEKLSDLGIGDERIFFFPSWEPDGKKFINERARLRWPRHRKYTVSFEEVWLAGGRLGRSFACGGLADMSAGKWRTLFYKSEARYPAVYPSAERRKYAFIPGRHSSKETIPPSDIQTIVRGGGEVILAKFAGLGRYGRHAFARASHLARAGFSPPVLGMEHGFLMYRLIPGRPVSPRGVNDALIAAIADYLVFVSRNFSSDQGMPFDAMIEMVCCNVREGLGHIWTARLRRSIHAYRAAHGINPVAVDGRMLPHEWLAAEHSYIKTDETDHHADHFFPGCQDIAWDIAGCIAEFGLNGRFTDRLLERYISRTGDTGLPGRLPFYTIAYCAYRLGFSTIAADALAATADGEKFRRLAAGYVAKLKEAIGRGEK